MQQVALGNSSVSIVNGVGNTYSRLLSWEVWNFMTILHGKVEYDEKNILNFKGYNDSGKSAMIRALDVLLFNIKPTSQVGFIQDDKEYFRVMAYFDDGVVILRDKYINGQSLYEMYKDNECIFSTRVNGVNTKVAEVPQVIQDYLGVLSYEGFNLNSRSCFEKQLLVQTTGSENYKFLNAVLKSEEIAIASSMLNTDKNKLMSDINATASELEIYKTKIVGSEGITAEVLTELHRVDKFLDALDDKLITLGTLQERDNSLKEIPNIPELAIIDTKQIEILESVLNVTTQLSSIPNLPELKGIESEQLDILSSVTQVLGQLNSIPSVPEMKQLSLEQLDLLGKIKSVFDEISENEVTIEQQTERLETLNKESQTLESQLSEFGHKFVKCKNCGTLMELGEEHLH